MKEKIFLEFLKRLKKFDYKIHEEVSNEEDFFNLSNEVSLYYDLTDFLRKNSETFNISKQYGCFDCCYFELDINCCILEIHINWSMNGLIVNICYSEDKNIFKSNLEKKLIENFLINSEENDTKKRRL